jgi:uncharacterized protein YecE (DUF72 family)
MSEIRVGCSGWSYRHWKKGVFYPDGLRAKDEFAYYASRFDTAELNGSFYRLPTESAVLGWRDTAPPGFLFAWKASRFITHMKRLLDPAEPLELMFSRADLLGDKLGPILFQLPPQMQRNDERLAVFVDHLSPARRYAFEFRHPSWYAQEVFDLLEGRDCALCVSDHHHAPAPWRRTASWAYVRGHGPGGRYWGRYPQAVLDDWARRISAWRDEGADIVCYFDNDPEGSAPIDADLLIDRLSLAAPRGAEPRSAPPSRRGG